MGNSRSTERIDTVVGTKTEIRGDLHFTGGLRIDGCVIGKIVSSDKSGDTVVVGETGQIEGEVHAPRVIIDGAVKGNVIATGQIDLRSQAVVNGDLRCATIDMAFGSTLNGRLVCAPLGTGATTADRAGAKNSGGAA